MCNCYTLPFCDLIARLDSASFSQDSSVCQFPGRNACNLFQAGYGRAVGPPVFGVPKAVHGVPVFDQFGHFQPLAPDVQLTCGRSFLPQGTPTQPLIPPL